MVVPNQVAIAAQNGNVAAVEAWLNEGGDVNERSIHDDTLLLSCAATQRVRTTSHIDLVRLLLERGADVNICASENPPAMGFSALHYACDQLYDSSAEMVALLLDAKANVHCRAQGSPEDDSLPADTPLGVTLLGFHDRDDQRDQRSSAERFPTILRIVTMLLRAGASLDAVSDERAAETELEEIEERYPDLRDNDTFLQTKALICAVRAAGSWKLYCRRDHKQILRLRSLVARGRATPKKWSPRGHDRRAIEFLVKLGDNGIVWNILSFWKET